MITTSEQRNKVNVKLWYETAGNKYSKEALKFHVNKLLHSEVEELNDAADQRSIFDAIGDVWFVRTEIDLILEHVGNNALLDPSIKRGALHAADAIIYDMQMHDQKLLQRICAEVIKSNFSKFCKTEEEAADTLNWYRDTKRVYARYEKVGDLFVIRSLLDQKDSNGNDYPKDKILKSINFKGPDFSALLEAA
jgi:hypothetical protein